MEEKKLEEAFCIIVSKVTCFREIRRQYIRGKKSSLLNEGIFPDPCRLSITVGIDNNFKCQEPPQLKRKSIWHLDSLSR